MRLWRFFDYYPDGGECPISTWRNSLDLEAKSRFDAAVDDLDITDDWEEPEKKSFGVMTEKPEHAGLSAIKFYVIRLGKKTHYRAIGRWRKNAREFIFLTGFQKNGRTTIPLNALSEAVTLLGELELQRGEIHEHLAETGEGQALS